MDLFSVLFTLRLFMFFSDLFTGKWLLMYSLFYSTLFAGRLVIVLLLCLCIISFSFSFFNIYSSYKFVYVHYYCFHLFVGGL